MKLAIVTSFPENPQAPRGGVEAVSVNLTRGLAAYPDLEVHVVTADPDCPEVTLSSWEGATIHRLPGFKGSVLLNAIGPARKQITEYLVDLAPDVVHAHDTYGLMVKGLPIRRVFTIHGFIYGDTLVSGRKLPRIRARIWRYLETGGWADQPHIVSISPYVRERLAGIATGVIHDIDNPISESFFQIERREAGARIFSASVISPRKNTMALVEALAILKAEGIDAELRLAGDVTDEAYGEKLHTLIHDRGLVDRVHLLGRIGTDAIRGELAGASLFALVSLEENSPMGIEEAMAAGVPVVTSNRCGMPYMVRDGESGYLVDPFSPKDIARRLGRILRDDTLRSAMSRRSREIALDRFHPEAVARRTREVYLETLNGNGSRSPASPESTEPCSH